VHDSVTERRGNAIATVCDAMLSVFSYWPRSIYGVGSAEDVTQLTDAMQSLEQTLQSATRDTEVMIATVQCYRAGHICSIKRKSTVYCLFVQSFFLIIVQVYWQGGSAYVFGPSMCAAAKISAELQSSSMVSDPLINNQTSFVAKQLELKNNMFGLENYALNHYI